MLLRERTPEERQRLAEAWERVAGGDPDSLPALYALADRFSLEAHAALLNEIRSIHSHLEGMAREIGQGASVTVQRTEAAAQATSDHAALFRGLIPKLEGLAVDQEQASTKAIQGVKATAENIESSLRAARQQYDRSENWKTTAFMALIAGVVFAVLGAAGFLTGAELRNHQERRELNALLARWRDGDDAAYRQLMERVEAQRQQPVKPKPQ